MEVNQQSEQLITSLRVDKRRLRERVAKEKAHGNAVEVRLSTVEAQLAEANSKLDKYSGMCVSCPDMGMTLVVERLEQELAAANDKARLQRALDRIEKAGWYARRLFHSVIEGKAILEIMKSETDSLLQLMTTEQFEGSTRAEAAEMAAAWVEGQKEGGECL